MAEETPIGYASDEQIDAWKNQTKQRKIAEVYTIDDDGNDHVCYLKKPTLDNLQMLADYAKKSKEMKGLQLLFNTLWLGGSEEVKTDSEMYLSAMTKCEEIFKPQEAKLKKR